MASATPMPRLAKWLTDNGKTHEQLAAELGVTAPAISHYVVGRHRPTIDRLLSLSRITGLSVEELLGPSDEEPGQGRRAS